MCGRSRPRDRAAPARGPAPHAAPGGQHQTPARRSGAPETRRVGRPWRKRWALARHRATRYSVRSPRPARFGGRTDYRCRGVAELVWDGKYDRQRRLAAPLRVPLPFQTVETVNESAQERQRSLDLFTSGRDTEWRNRLIWGDKKYVLPALLEIG